jgi:hypothetical protein
VSTNEPAIAIVLYNGKNIIYNGAKLHIPHGHSFPLLTGNSGALEDLFELRVKFGLYEAGNLTPQNRFLEQRVLVTESRISSPASY